LSDVSDVSEPLKERDDDGADVVAGT